MIEGDLGSAGLGALKNLSELAKKSGAKSLQIEASLANERLLKVLQRRYGVTTKGGDDLITIPLE